MENLENVIESVLFVAGEPVLCSDLCFKFDVKQKEIDKAVQKLQQKYDGKSGIKLLSFNNKLQFSECILILHHKSFYYASIIHKKMI